MRVRAAVTHWRHARVCLIPFGLLGHSGYSVVQLGWGKTSAIILTWKWPSMRFRVTPLIKPLRKGEMFVRGVGILEWI